MSPDADESAMQLALAEAGRGIGLTAPNPPVGAVIMRDNLLLGKGFHQFSGGPHAEIEALTDASSQGHDVTGATIYITLEPCSTQGRTPPCVDALLASKLSRVVWGMRDPNPAHLGRAAALLTTAGIDVTTGVCETECREILRPFRKRVQTGLPWVIAKAGMSLDGRITRPASESQWLTSTAARADAMLLRSTCEAVVVGADTIRQDNPALTVRDPALRPGQAQPWRAILTRTGNLPPSFQVFTDSHRDRTLVFENQPFETVLRNLTARGVMSVLLEGGGLVHAAAFSGGLVDEVVFYVAPLISGLGRPVVDSAGFGGGSIPLQFVDFKQVGADLRIRALVKNEVPA